MTMPCLPSQHSSHIKVVLWLALLLHRKKGPGLLSVFLSMFSPCRRGGLIWDFKLPHRMNKWCMHPAIWVVFFPQQQQMKHVAGNTVTNRISHKRSVSVISRSHFWEGACQLMVTQHTSTNPILAQANAHNNLALDVSKTQAFSLQIAIQAHNRKLFCFCLLSRKSLKICSWLCYSFLWLTVSGINTGLKFHVSDFIKMGLGDNQPSEHELTRDGWTLQKYTVNGVQVVCADSSLYTHVYMHSEAQTIC